ncbi:TetR/AcrR family transcriptional regulator [Nocardia arthritidis]|uniref:TetR family transcriptional regulator n=1 Tax=Nocardia arthritidis TaxID=228602 RepID=A0A6G9YP07_9NOCA|nr:TetR/AcrR family transcriptional regulator [Nocardia arthritidis]QIS14921.1 TetR family transcriptional regulator [Nocardia arthritidis]
MAARRPAATRKIPRQQRSREMVRRIIDAGQAVLIDHGYEGASTNRIAAAADISPGSLYQYFPNKDAIIAAVIDRYHAELTARIGDSVMAGLTQPPEIAGPTAIAALLDALSEHPRLLRAVVEHTPRLDSAHTVHAFEHQIGEIARAALRMRKQSLPDDIDADATAWLLVRAVEHLTIRYVLDRPPIPRDRFLTDITRLISNFFLTAPPSTQTAW